MIDVYLLFTEDFEVKENQEYLHYLTLDEKKTLNEFVFEADKHRFMLSRQLTRRVLAQKMNMDFQEILLGKNEHGKLIVQEPSNGLPFSLAFSDNLIVLVVNNHGNTVGAATQDAGKEIGQEAFKQIFTRLEIQTFLKESKSEQEQHFYELWGLKESLMRALGQGLPIDPTTIEFSYVDGAFHLQAAPAEFATQHLDFELLSPTKDLRLAICHDKLGAAVKGHRILPDWQQEEFAWQDPINA